MGLNSYTIGGQAAGNFAISLGSGAGCAGALAVAIGAGTQGNAETCVVIGRGSGAAPGAVSAVSIGESAACNDIFCRMCRHWPRARAVCPQFRAGRRRVCPRPYHARHLADDRHDWKRVYMGRHRSGLDSRQWHRLFKPLGRFFTS